MTQLLRQSTSAVVSLGPFMNTAGAVQTSLTIANTDIQLSKNGAAYAAKSGGGANHAVNGMYLTTLEAADVGTVGRLDVSVLVVPAMVVPARFQVVEEAVYDALLAAGATGYSTLTTADLATLDVAVSTRSSHSPDAVWTSGSRTVTGGSVDTLAGHTPQSGDNFARLGAPSGASIAADIARVMSGLPTKPTRGVGLPNFTFSMVNTAGDPLPGLTVSGLVRLDGTAFVALANPVTEVGAGFYSANIVGSEMAADEVTLLFTASGAVSRSFYMLTQPALS